MAERIDINVNLEVGDGLARLRGLRAELQGVIASTADVIRKQGEWAGGLNIARQTAALRDQITALEKLGAEAEISAASMRKLAEASRAANQRTIEYSLGPETTRELVSTRRAPTGRIENSLGFAARADDEARLAILAEKRIQEKLTFENSRVTAGFTDSPKMVGFEIPSTIGFTNLRTEAQRAEESLEKLKARAIELRAAIAELGRDPHRFGQVLRPQLSQIETEIQLRSGTAPVAAAAIVLANTVGGTPDYRRLIDSATGADRAIRSAASSASVLRQSLSAAADSARIVRELESSRYTVAESLDRVNLIRSGGPENTPETSRKVLREIQLEAESAASKVRSAFSQGFIPDSVLHQTESTLAKIRQDVSRTETSIRVEQEKTAQAARRQAAESIIRAERVLHRGVTTAQPSDPGPTQQTFRAIEEEILNVRKKAGNFGLNRIGFLELEAAGVNTFQALASGMDPFHVAIMESSQVMGALVQGGLIPSTSILGFFASAAGTATIAVTALAGAMAFVAYKTYETNKAIKDSENSIRLLGQGSSITPNAASRDHIKAMTDYGESASTTNEILSSFNNSTAAFSQQQRKQLEDLARAYGALKGIGSIDAAKMFGQATEQGSTGLLNLAERFNIRDPLWREHIKDLIDVGKGAEANSSLIQEMGKSFGVAGKEVAQAGQQYGFFVNSLQTGFNPIAWATQGAVSLFNSATGRNIPNPAKMQPAISETIQSIQQVSNQLSPVEGQRNRIQEQFNVLKQAELNITKEIAQSQKTVREGTVANPSFVTPIDPPNNFAKTLDLSKQAMKDLAATPAPIGIGNEHEYRISIANLEAQVEKAKQAAEKKINYEQEAADLIKQIEDKTTNHIKGALDEQGAEFKRKSEESIVAARRSANARRDVERAQLSERLFDIDYRRAQTPNDTPTQLRGAKEQQILQIESSVSGVVDQRQREMEILNLKKKIADEVRQTVTAQSQQNEVLAQNRNDLEEIVRLRKGIAALTRANPDATDAQKTQADTGVFQAEIAEEQEKHNIRMVNLETQLQKAEQAAQGEISLRRHVTSIVKQMQDEVATHVQGTLGKIEGATQKTTTQMISAAQRVWNAWRETERMKLSERLFESDVRRAQAPNNPATQLTEAQKQLNELERASVKNVQEIYSKKIEIIGLERQLSSAIRETALAQISQNETLAQARGDLVAMVDLARQRQALVLGDKDRTPAQEKTAETTVIQSQINAQQKALQLTQQVTESANRFASERLSTATAMLDLEVAQNSRTKESAIQAEMSMTSTVMAQQQQRTAALLQQQGLAPEQRAQINDQLASLYEQDAQKQLSLQTQLTEQIKQENEKRVQNFKNFFQSVETGAADLLVAGVTRSQTRTQALQNLARSLTTSFITEMTKMGSQYAGKELATLLDIKIDPSGDTSISAVLSKGLGSVLGITKPEPANPMKDVAPKLQLAADAHQAAAKALSESAAALTATANKAPYLGGKAEAIAPSSAAEVQQQTEQAITNSKTKGRLPTSESAFEGQHSIVLDDLESSRKAIRKIESGSPEGNYSALGPVTKSGDRGHGAYQVMGVNVPSWTKEHFGERLTPSQFLNNKTAQDAVFTGQFGKYTEKYGAEGASRAWFAGEGGMNNLGAQDITGSSVGGYNSKFSQLKNQYSRTQAQEPIAANSSTASGGITIDDKSYPNVREWNLAMDAKAAKDAPSMLPSTYMAEQQRESQQDSTMQPITVEPGSISVGVQQGNQGLISQQQELGSKFQSDTAATQASIQATQQDISASQQGTQEFTQNSQTNQENTSVTQELISTLRSQSSSVSTKQQPSFISGDEWENKSSQTDFVGNDNSESDFGSWNARSEGGETGNNITNSASSLRGTFGTLNSVVGIASGAMALFGGGLSETGRKIMGTVSLLSSVMSLLGGMGGSGGGGGIGGILGPLFSLIAAPFTGGTSLIGLATGGLASVTGGLYEQGGIIPSAAGGMFIQPVAHSLPASVKDSVREMAGSGNVVPFKQGYLLRGNGGANAVPDGKGGRLIIAHPGEMILPASETAMILSSMRTPSAEEGFINNVVTSYPQVKNSTLNVPKMEFGLGSLRERIGSMANDNSTSNSNSGGNTFQYNANVTGYHPYKSKASFEGMLRQHGGSMERWVEGMLQNRGVRI